MRKSIKVIGVAAAATVVGITIGYLLSTPVEIGSVWIKKGDDPWSSEYYTLTDKKGNWVRLCSNRRSDDPLYHCYPIRDDDLFYVFEPAERFNP